MAVLSDPDRALVSQLFQQDRSSARDGFAALTKAQLLAAVNGLDDYLNTNAATINQAIPLPARTALTTAQKALLLQFVITRRYLVGA